MTNDTKNLLRIQNLSKTFPGVQALDKVNLELLQGEVHGLMGENGAGKSTLMKILCGVYRRDGGRIVYLGREIEFNRSHNAQVAGIIPVYQELSLCENMNIAENIFIHRQPSKYFFGAIHWKRLYQDTRDLLGRFNLNISPSTLVADLSVSVRQQVEILKALSLKPKVLVLDEPTSSLGRVESELLFKILLRLRKEGVGIIYIAHNVEEVIEISDRISVLRDGRYVGTVPAQKATRADLIQMMVGRTISNLYPESGQVTDKPIFEVKGLADEKAECDISFKVFRGEIVGIAGLVGSGRSKMAKMIFGLEARSRGGFFINGEKVAWTSHRDAIRRGIAYVPKDRKAQGLFLDMALSRNVVAARLDRFSSHGFMDAKLELRETEKFVNLLKIKTAGYSQEVNALSGGNQQKVLLAKWLSVNPKVLLIDEPTRGIDVATKSEIHQLIRRLADQGVAVIMISSELPEILGMSDRILVMHEGRIVGEFRNQDAGQKIIMECISQAIAGRQKVDYGIHSQSD
jgi:ribose transport system ATP-binding protein